MLDQAIKKLAEARHKHWKLKEQKLLLQQKFDEDHAELFTALAAAKEEESAADEEVREQALNTYTETGNKTLHDAVTIKMYRVPDYDVEYAITWAQENFRDALSLDKRVFNKAVKEGLVPERVATMENEPRIHVASDLSLLLED